MSYPGGVAAKHGERFEARWTVNCILDILRGNAESIRLEPLGEDGVGVEFLLVRNGQREFHQVKRRGGGRWTLAALKEQGVLAVFAAKRQGGDAARFVSEQDAYELRVLGERARDAADLSDFLHRLGGETWTQAFRTASNHMGLSESEAYSALKDIHVTVIDEQQLTILNEAWVEPLIDGEPADVLADLADLIRDAVPGDLDATSVLTILTERYGKTGRRWTDDPDLATHIDELADAYEQSLRGVRLEHPLDRLEISEVLDALQDDALDGVLVTGTAGSGKSDALLEVVSRARAASWSVLCIRADRLEPTPTPSGIGAQLDLPGSPVGVLAAVARQRPSLVVIDQLDAVSLASGRVTGLWDALYAVICQVQSMPNMKLVVACRQFDINNDHRLRTLTGEEHRLLTVALPSLTGAQIDEAVRNMHLDPERLTDRQRSLLTVPLHLTLLQTIAPESTALDFRTSTELFDRYWRRKQKEASTHAGRPIRWGAVIETASNFMSTRMRLSVPASQFDAAELAEDAEALASEHVLVADTNTYRFFHESFFDYAFARLYLASGSTVGDLLIQESQDLFRRAQVRQLLAQQRDVDFDSYVATLAELLERSDIRFHIKQLVIAWLASLDDPSVEEVRLLARILANADRADPRAPLIWRVFGHLPWFDRAHADGLVNRWLISEDPALVDTTMELLGTVINERADTVLDLTEGKDDGSDMWTARLAYLVRFGDVQSSRRLFELLIDLLERDAFLASADHDAWLYGHELPDTHPDWAAELLAALLERAATRARDDGQTHPFYDGAPLQHEYSAIEFIVKLSEATPKLLLSTVLPFMFSVIDNELRSADRLREMPDRLPQDSIWAYRLSDDAYTFDDTLLASSRAALKTLAASEPGSFSQWAEELSPRRDDTSQYLLYHGFLGNPSENADRAAGVLLEGPWRFAAEEKGDAFWLPRELLAAIAPYLSNDRMDELERAIIDFTTPWERTAQGYRARGRSEYWLLSGLSQGEISERARRRLGELERKFPESGPKAPVGIIAGAVTSPISMDIGRRMSDEEWLKAIAKHREQWEDKRTTDLVGGADQLAAVLQELTQEQPDRFARLGLRLASDTVESYIDHLLIGLSQVAAEVPPASIDNVAALCRHIADWPGMPGSRWIPLVLRKYAHASIPDDLLELVARIATDAPDPNRELWNVEAGGGQHYYNGDIHAAGMNSARGSAAEALGELVVQDERRVVLLAPAITRLAHDSIASVKSCAARAVYGLMRWRREEAVENLLVLADGPDRLLATRPVQELMVAAIATHWGQVRPIVERMLGSAEGEVRETGAALASVAALEEADADDLLTQALDDTDSRIRRGVATVLAARVASSRYRGRSAVGLRRLFDDDDSEVRQEAAKAFWRVHDHQLAELAEISSAFVSSSAFDGNHQHFLRALETSTADVSDLVLATADRMVSSYGNQLGDIRGHIGGDSRHLSELLLRVLGTLGIERAKVDHALDVLDLMLEAGAWGVTEALDTVDR
jgi:hypothetical protein